MAIAVGRVGNRSRNLRVGSFCDIGIEPKPWRPGGGFAPARFRIEGAEVKLGKEEVLVAVWTLLVIGVTWRWGGVLPRERFLFVVGAVSLVLLTCLRWWSGAGFPRDLPLTLWWPAAGFFLWVLASLTPLPQGVLKVVSPLSAALWRRSDPAAFHRLVEDLGSYVDLSSWLQDSLWHRTRFPWSVFPEGTWTDALAWAAGLMVAFALAYGLTRRRTIRWICGSLLAFAVVESAYGLVLYWTGSGPERSGEGAAGTFYNRDHFVDFLGMVLPLAVVMWINLFRRVRRYGPRTRWGKVRAVLNAHLGAFPIMSLTVFVLLLGIGFSLSRGGIAASLMVLGLMILFPPRFEEPPASRRRRSRPEPRPRGSGSRRGWIRMIALVTLIGIGLVLWVGPQPIVERFARTERELELNRNRLNAWRDSLRLLPRTWFAGTGMGTFGEVFLGVQSFDAEHRWGYAHNEYLQLLVETGLVGVGLVFILAGGILRYIRRHPRKDPEMGLYRYGALMGLAYLALHALTDFNLHIPANVLLAGTLLGLSLALSRNSMAILMHQVNTVSSSYGTWFRRVLVLAGLAAVAVVSIRHYRAESLTDALRVTAKARPPVAEDLLERARHWLYTPGGPPRLFQYLGVREAAGSGRADLAAAAFVKAALLNPQDYVSRHNLAQILWRIYPSFRWAETMFRHAMAIAPADAQVRFNAGLFFWTVGEVEPALRTWRRAVELRPGLLATVHRELANVRNPDYLVRVTPRSEYPALARNLFRYGFTDSAREVLRELLQQGTLEEAAQVLDLAVLHPDLGLAPAFFQRLKRYRESDPRIEYWYIYSLLQSGRTGEIPERVREAVRLSERVYGLRDPRVLADRLRLGQLLARFGFPETARSLYLEILAVNPNYLEAHRAMAELAVQQQKYREAFDALREAPLDQRTRDLLFRVGRGALSQGDVGFAREVFEYMKLRWAFRGYGHYGMALLLEHQGDPWGALDEVNKALGAEPDQPEMQALKTRLEAVVHPAKTGGRSGGE